MSATTIDNVKRTFTTNATATIAKYSLVKLDTDGSVSVATSSNSEVRAGFLDADNTAVSEPVSVVLLNGGGTAYGIAASTITNAGTALYGATTGKVGTTATGSIVGYTLESGASANDVIEILLA